jgi:hypothetical protein
MSGNAAANALPTGSNRFFDYVAGENLALDGLPGSARAVAAGAALSQRIVDRDNGIGGVPEVREVSGIHFRKRHGRNVRRSLAAAKRFPSSEEKDPVLFDRPAAVQSVLILLESRLASIVRDGEKVGSV